MKKECPFCRSSKGKSSKEHIFPVWMLEHFGISNAEINPTHISSITGKAISQRKHVLSNLLLGGVCEDCNGGWMSDLEASNMETIKSLADLSTSLKELSEEEKFSLARWTLKTSITLNLGSNYRKKIGDAEIQHFYKNKDTLPENVIVVAKQVESSSPLYWLQGLPWVYEGPDTDDSEKMCALTEYGWKVGFQFRGIFLCAAFNPFDDCHFSLSNNDQTILKDTSLKTTWRSGESNKAGAENVLLSLGIGIQMISNKSELTTQDDTCPTS